MEVKRRFGELRAVDSEKRTAEFIISTSTKDRHGTVLNQRNWDLKNYEKNPIVGYNHNVYGSWFGDENPDNIIGKSQVWLEGDNLMGRVEFEPEDMNPMAEKLFKKVEFGTIRATSVGFYPLKDDKGKEGKWGEGEEARDGKEPTFYYHGQELLEWSIVNIPSNPDAIKNSLPKDKEEFIRHILGEMFGDKLNWEQIECLTVKGILNIINGGDISRIIEEDEGVKVDPEILKKKIEILKKITE